ncbi:alpha/beta hydrolase [Williamsia sp. CHRR-6]|uniref:alpha/beta hydrolase n=1 Tax=Williamsia sp. CHRR-6 TaxID=2835871 RepID=UPI001BDAC66A|nr:alpha/beta hydrolase [Williamsia sp. CHRR-6]MBT0567671.1 alpha/beta hydrolase [Williamsia sp. CHRR-6]
MTATVGSLQDTGEDFPWHSVRGSIRARGFSTSMRWAVPAVATGFGVRSAAAANAPSPALIRAVRPVLNQTITRLSPVPRGTVTTTVRDATGIRGEWVHGPDVLPGARIIYYLHGSGYVVCTPRTHRGVVARLSALTGLPAFTLDYRKGPEHRFPTAGDDAIAGYHWLLDRGFTAEQIVVAGDSAGGHMTLDLLAHNHAHGTPQPGAIVMFSPLSDPTFGLSLARQAGGHRDPILDARLGEHVLRMYLGDTPADHPRMTIQLPQGISLPPTLIQVGGQEVMADDARDIHARMITAGASCELQVWPDQNHVFQLFPLISPDANRAVRAAARFIDRHI